jgi:hypothetical protein
MNHLTVRVVHTEPDTQQRAGGDRKCICSPSSLGGGEHGREMVRARIEYRLVQLALCV